jgi:glucose-6-phosphate dehydrogenase assembly protein OpcA
MILTLEGTTSAKISAELVRIRRSVGSPAQGMVLTLIIVCDESEFASALEASIVAGREHPSRILLVVTAAGRDAALDAEVRIGEGTPGEVVVIRMRGAVAAHPASVIRPLLLPDSPVVIWWPGKAPGNRAGDELAQLAMRRMTDAAASPRPADGTAVARSGVHAWRYRSELDEAYAVAGAAGSSPRPVPGQDQVRLH